MKTAAKIFDSLLFLLSAAVVAGALFGLQKMEWVTIVGYGLALFWMLCFQGAKGMMKAYEEDKKRMVQIFDQMIEAQNNKDASKNEK